MLIINSVMLPAIPKDWGKNNFDCIFQEVDQPELLSSRVFLNSDKSKVLTIPSWFRSCSDAAVPKASIMACSDNWVLVEVFWGYQLVQLLP